MPMAVKISSFLRGGGWFLQFSCSFLFFPSPNISPFFHSTNQIFSYSALLLIKYFPPSPSLGPNVWLFTSPKGFLQNFYSSPKYQFRKIPGSPPSSRKANSVFQNLFADLSRTICACHTTFLSLLPCERRSQGSAIWWEVAINCRWPKHWWESLEITVNVCLLCQKLRARDSF